jgi:hypothetical protein
MTHSGFRHHPHVGLVADAGDEFGTRLREIAGASVAGSAWWRRWM